MNIDRLTTPFWTGDTIAGEPMFFIRRSPREKPRARLLFVPDRILSLRDATLERSYQEDRDFTVDYEKGIVFLTADSRIPFKTIRELYPPADGQDLPAFIRKRGAPDTGLLFGEEAVFHKLQAVADYTHVSDKWSGPVPVSAGDRLPHTAARLKHGNPIVLGVTGDSISAGANASGAMNCPPYQPGYAELVADGIARKYGSQVALRNIAVGGWSSAQGKAGIAPLAAERPDLTIVAFGMNDNRATDVEEFIDNIQAIVEAVRDRAPEAEFVLVASMTGNAEWARIRPEQFPLYRDGLAKLTGRGVVLADLTAMWDALLTRKSFHDLTGNGVNHPNDFGHRVYAHTILKVCEPSL